MGKKETNVVVFFSFTGIDEWPTDPNGSLDPSPGGRHVEHPGEVPMARLHHRDVTHRWPHGLRADRQGPSAPIWRQARPLQAQHQVSWGLGGEGGWGEERRG